MPIAERISYLRKMTDAQLEAQYDGIAATTQVGLNHYLTEINRRNQERQTETMLGYTRQIRGMTRVITILTLVNVVFVALQVYRTLSGS